MVDGDRVAGISATSEDIPNKIEDLRSECSSDFGGKDSVTSPDGEEAGHGRRQRLSCHSCSPVFQHPYSPYSYYSVGLLTAVDLLNAAHVRR